MPPRPSPPRISSPGTLTEPDGRESGAVVVTPLSFDPPWDKRVEGATGMGPVLGSDGAGGGEGGAALGGAVEIAHRAAGTCATCWHRGQRTGLPGSPSWTFRGWLQWGQVEAIMRSSGPRMGVGEPRPRMSNRRHY